MRLVNRRMRYNMAMYGLLAVMMVGVFGLMAALNDVARWGGYADSLPLLGLFIVFLVGQLMLTPRRRVRRGGSAARG